MMLSDKALLVAEVELFLRDLGLQKPQKESVEWYLQNNLIEYLSELQKTQNLCDLKTPTKILSRFCLDSMDWDTPLFKRCTKITELGLKIAKNS